MLPPQFMPPGAKKAPTKPKMGVPTKTAGKPAKKPAKKGC